MAIQGKRALVLSFSGLDGAGKSTQIENVRAQLAAAGLSDRLLAFWDDVVVGSRWREGFVHKVYKSERGIGAPGKPVQRRDKNVRKWYLNLLRHGLYLLDAIHLRWVAARAQQSGADVVIFDRYLYDQLANLPLANPLTRAYVKIVRALAPQPDLAFLLDADPQAAHERKPEYPVEFMREARRSYFEVARQMGTMNVIPPLPLEQAQAAVVRAVAQVLPQLQAPQAEIREVA